MDSFSRRVNALSGELLFVGSAVAMVALSSHSRRGQLRRQLSSSSERVTTLHKPPNTPPVAVKRRDTVYFGKHPDKPDEFRGPHAMDPPIIKYDDYNWMRDESRKDEKVLYGTRLL